MQYSLRLLNQKSDLNSLTLTEFINTLNLIGFEIDNVFFEKINNLNSENINIEIKLPSNREDLLIEFFLLLELKTIFSFKFYSLWKNLKNNYTFILKQKYLQHNTLEIIPIYSEFDDFISYRFELDNYQNKKSPLWLQNKLKINGLIPENIIEDIIQLVNFEWGQTIKYSKVDSNSKNYSLIKTTTSEQFSNSINNNNLIIENETIVIKDNNNSISNILGYSEKLFEISEITNRKFIIESTFYNIHENLLDLNTNNTKLSLRYLRKSYLTTFRSAFQRFFTLIELLTDIKILPRVHILNKKKFKLNSNQILKVQKESLTKYLNITEFNKTIFTKAGLILDNETSDDFYFNISSVRNDLKREVDIIEEYSRFIGYKNYLEILPKKELKFSNKIRHNINFIKTFFINYNFFEVFTNSLVENTSGLSNVLKITNPINNELSILRKSLLPNLISIYQTNLLNESVSKNFFEIGRVFKKSKNKIIEQEQLSAIFSLNFLLNNPNKNINWFIAKGFIENFLKFFGFNTLSNTKILRKDSNFHPNKSLYIKFEDQILGKFGEINPTLKEKLSLKAPLYLLELNLIYFTNWKLKSDINCYKEYSKYPQIIKDLSFSIKKNSDFFKIKDLIQKNIKYLKNISFFDLYFDSNITENVNVGLHLIFQSEFETLQNEIIENEIIKIRFILKNELNVEFRN